MRSWIAWAAVLCLLAAVLAGCTTGTDTSSPQGGGDKVTGELAFPVIEGFTSDKVTILAGALTVSEEQAALLKTRRNRRNLAWEIW